MLNLSLDAGPAGSVVDAVALGPRRPPITAQLSPPSQGLFLQQQDVF